MESAWYQSRQTVNQQRFGLGARTDSTTQVAEPLQQLKLSHFVHSSIAHLPSSAAVLAVFFELTEKRKQATSDSEKRAISKSINQQIQGHFRNLIHARNLQTLYTPYGFQERIVQFWSNHFAISADVRRVKPIASSLENEVIRAHWDRDFLSMLLAVNQHPAMLLYLDNHQSIGPNSKTGKKRNKGLNENLAREILELHTLGVNGGYTQEDVLALAKAITGWSLSNKTFEFQFKDQLHEPGGVNILGKEYTQPGLIQGETVISDLANNPNTAKHIVDKLAYHFLGTESEKVAQSMLSAWLESEGSLLAVYQALLTHPSAYEPFKRRFRTPNEWFFAVLRSAAIEPSAKQMQGMLRQLGQEPFMALSPAGWPDSDADFNSPSALTQRWQVANQVAQLLMNSLKAGEISASDKLTAMIEMLYGSTLEQHTQVAIENAPDPLSKFVLLWMSPQFQYR
ncbi:DUF1800 domain-containing protein [Vibrio sp. ZSDZ34]|uniref:DUF1800 domain-containing protein n=1 Tax=Vibrio gelatinilyticus TaxID=2893468 RepID=A0A9X1W9I3_9VIBR|nr:DUF1800 domain-containing protein [Vibrio gelatinilyticus]MCJ2376777.1 DUF1800 domain-containing protein [Vibrio gelatinilyticus]